MTQPKTAIGQSQASPNLLAWSQADLLRVLQVVARISLYPDDVGDVDDPDLPADYRDSLGGSQEVFVDYAVIREARRILRGMAAAGVAELDPGTIPPVILETEDGGLVRIGPAPSWAREQPAPSHDEATQIVMLEGPDAATRPSGPGGAL